MGTAEGHCRDGIGLRQILSLPFGTFGGPIYAPQTEDEVLRRVLARMHFAEGAELLITRLDDVEKTDDFLERFTVDPEA